eukprot:276944_1
MKENKECIKYHYKDCKHCKGQKNTKRVCNKCNGTTKAPNTGSPCWECDGSGFLPQECFHCDGRGTTQKKCSKCLGMGTLVPGLNPITCHKSTFPKNHRFCAFIDRRKYVDEKERNVNLDKNDEIRFFIPPS